MCNDIFFVKKTAYLLTWFWFNYLWTLKNKNSVYNNWHHNREKAQIFTVLSLRSIAIFCFYFCSVVVHILRVLKFMVSVFIRSKTYICDCWNEKYTNDTIYLFLVKLLWDFDNIVPMFNTEFLYHKTMSDCWLYFIQSLFCFSSINIFTNHIYILIDCWLKSIFCFYFCSVVVHILRVLKFMVSVFIRSKTYICDCWFLLRCIYIYI
jgi:hypothetical protein